MLAAKQNPRGQSVGFNENGAGAGLFSDSQNTTTATREAICANTGKVVGVVMGDIFKRDNARASVHLLRQYPGPGWAYGVEVLAAAELAGARRLQIHDTEANVTYTTTLETLKEHGRAFERNAGPQVCLPLKWWTTDTTPPAVTEATPTRTRRAAKYTPPPLSGADFTGAQLDLFADSARAADSVLENAHLQPDGKRRAAMRRRAQRLTRKLAREICEAAAKGGGQ